ncbi:transmembrane protein, putative (macronuclear) [Tetrahymena thermophila SB210]|uniref:Transmembrane protein, putative n=1 Tax=Tetrahymena thermophila (strain SB210) TaxID=312017 RepID=A4VER4_TETTS|nr:transmembrane protein, putative [Tetrahymena thermophila SB210]EDK32027.1 transmembrane protein, putative [Tetrahymena thermophila SB210]|eukprot:XP_001471121.1 transmembrane protein, putative [Tetrahymena thermophila SB210]
MQQIENIICYFRSMTSQIAKMKIGQKKFYFLTFLKIKWLAFCRNYILLESMYIIYAFLMLLLYVVKNTNKLTNNDSSKKSKVNICQQKHLHDATIFVRIVRRLSQVFVHTFIQMINKKIELSLHQYFYNQGRQIDRYQETYANQINFVV